MIDLSDGLIADLGHILKSSRVGAIIHKRTIPLSKNAKKFDSAIKDGEDFELVFTMKQSEADRLIRLWPFKTELSKIGEIRKEKNELILLKRDGKRKKVKPIGYSHF